MREVILRKPNNIDYRIVKSYPVITLLICLGKICEKVAAGMLADWGEVDQGRHEGRMKSRQQPSAFDAVSRVMNRILEA